MTVGNTIDVLISELVRSLDPSEQRARMHELCAEHYPFAHPETLDDDRSRL